jgi:hypothetical protein
MTQPTEGSQYLQRLIRHLAGTPAVTAAFAGGGLAAGGGDPFAELELYAVAPGGLGQDLPAFLAPVGETAYLSARGPSACRIVTNDGLAITLTAAPTAAALTGLTGTQALFDRTGSGGATPAGPATAPLPDLAAAAATFWHDLWSAAAAIGQGRPLTAHGRLESCRTALVDLYRLALAPGRPGAGYEAAEALPGAAALEKLFEWLVSPLDLREQWRCATRLAAAYESLVLPLLERLGLTYPWAMRNLAFARLDQVRPDRPAAGSTAANSANGSPDTEPVPRLRDTAAEESADVGAPGRTRIKVKIRRPPQNPQP